MTQSNLACSYYSLGQTEQALSMYQDVYSGRLKLNGEEKRETVLAAINYASSLIRLERFEEGKSLLRKMMPVARRVLGENHELTMVIRMNYAQTLHRATGATLDDLREALTTLEEIERTSRRVFGDAHPRTTQIEKCLRYARATSRAAPTHS